MKMNAANAAIGRLAGLVPGRLRKERGPKVAIVIPVYNGSNFLDPALRSAVGQDYANLEILVIDDGSTDRTPLIAARWARRDSRVRYVRKENGGVASALNRGIAEMTGDFFCWLSHDDVYCRHKVSSQVTAYLADHEGGKVVLSSDYDLIDEAGGRTGTVRHDATLVRDKPAYAVLRGLINGCTLFIPRGFFEEVGLFDESLPYTQDYDLWSRAHGTYRFVHMQDVLVQTRQHGAQASRRGDYADEFNAFWIRAMDRISHDEMAALEGSPYRFYQEMARFLTGAKAEDAAAHALRRAEAYADGIMVSVVIPFHRNVQELRAAVHSVQVQTHPRLETIIPAG